MIVLGIETSCDETSAAVVSPGPKLLAQVVRSQAELHRPYGGVVPEIACRSHVETLTTVIETCLRDAELTRDDLTAIAVAHRPGLIGALLVGLTSAKALSWAWKLPLIGVDHLQAHLEAPALAGVNVETPHLGVILSGGHSEITIVEDHDRRIIGRTQDDAIGEAFDKVASILGLPYPGGPSLEKEASKGNPEAVSLPRSLLGKDSLDFSFSGIKTAVLYLWRGQNGRSPGPVPGAPSIPDIAAGFQAAVFDVVIEKIRRAVRQTGLRRVVIGGGVTANRTLRRRMEESLGPELDALAFPLPEFSTDNGAMIAAAGLGQLQRGDIAALDLEARAS